MHLLTGSRARVFLAAAALFAAIFAVRFATGDAGNGLTFLYTLPVVILAVELGLLAGVVSGAVALGLYALWAVFESPDGLTFVGLASRGVAFAAVGAVTGGMAGRMRAATRRAEAAARHFEISRDMLCTANFDGYLTSVNDSWEKVLGWSPQELCSRPFIELVHPDDHEETGREAERAAGGDSTASFVNRFRAKDGSWRWIEWSSKVDPKTRTIYGAARDITERRQADEARREAEERFTRAFEDSATGMALVGVDGNVILAANDSLGRILGRPRDELVGRRTLAELADPQDVPKIAKGMERLESGDAPLFRGEVRIVRPDGRRVWVDVTASIVRDASGEPLYRMSQLVDVDARRRAEEQLRFLADHDTLSGVYNRRRFEQELQRELGMSVRKQSAGAVLLLDVDGFKEINDTLGHAVGDRVIARIGDALTDRLRSTDVVGRLGGDEFAVLLRRVDEQEARDVAASVRSITMEKLADVSADGIEHISLSVGVATFDAQDVPSMDDLLKAADHAMYEAKRAGGNQVALA